MPYLMAKFKGLALIVNQIYLRNLCLPIIESAVEDILC
jgi:hypothetical protein